jgi:hypothetical protein
MIVIVRLVYIRQNVGLDAGKLVQSNALIFFQKNPVFQILANANLKKKSEECAAHGVQKKAHMMLGPHLRDSLVRTKVEVYLHSPWPKKSQDVWGFGYGRKWKF